jgi:hypothetical protein
MSDPGAGFASQSSAWTTPPPVRHSYGLTVRDHGLATAFSLVIRTINRDWDARLASVSDKFGSLGAGSPAAGAG